MLIADIHAELTPEQVRNALLQHADRVAAVTDRMQMLRRPQGPTAGQSARQAAVLVLLYPGPEGLTVLVTERNSNLRKHAGQISFPGGGADPEDASLLETALRETREELGIDSASIEYWTTLHPIYVPPSNYLVHPFVAYVQEPPTVRPNLDEVAAVLRVPLAHLLQPECFACEEWEVGGQRRPVPHFRFGPHKIWGATAVILDQLLARISLGAPFPPSWRA